MAAPIILTFSLLFLGSWGKKDWGAGQEGKKGGKGGEKEEREKRGNKRGGGRKIFTVFCGVGLVLGLNSLFL